MTTIRHIARTVAGAGLAALTLGAAASAHHAITLNYDPNSSGVIEGVVQEVFWANPHVHFYIEVTAEDGTKTLWDLETGNLNVMRTRGIARDRIKVGDRIRTSGIVGRDGAPAILSDSLVMVDEGAVLWGDPDTAPVAEGYGERQD